MSRPGLPPIQAIVNLVESGFSVSTLSRLWRVKARTIINALREAGIEPKPRGHGLRAAIDRSANRALAVRDWRCKRNKNS